MRASWLLVGVCLTGCRGESGPSPAPPAVDAATPHDQPDPGPPAASAADPVPDEGATDGEVHGRLTITEGQRVLHVWGTPEEMGFAHGFLLRESIVEVLDAYALSVVTPETLGAVGPLYGTVADVSDELRRESQGIVDGMKAAGGAEVPGLGRALTANDLLVLNAMTDLLSIGCSSLSAWGEATQADAALAGEAVIVRNLDWSESPALLRNQLLIAYSPSDPERQPLLSVAFAGYIGCLSCINEAGVTALFNMGYGEGAASLPEALGGFAPANLMLRDAVERRDVDDDGLSTAQDIEHAVRGKTHAGSYILHVLEPAKLAAAAGRAPARVLEVEASGVHTRTPDAETKLGPSLLAATNHLRGKEGPQTCSRYDRIQRSVKASARAVDRERLWELGAAVRLPEVVHMMIVEPGSRSLRLWLRGPDESAESKRAPVVHEWDAVFVR